MAADHLVSPRCSIPNGGAIRDAAPTPDVQKKPARHGSYDDSGSAAPFIGALPAIPYRTMRTRRPNLLRDRREASGASPATSPRLGSGGRSSG